MNKQAVAKMLQDTHSRAKLARLVMDEAMDDIVYAAALESERAAWHAYEAFITVYNDGFPFQDMQS